MCKRFQLLTVVIVCMLTGMRAATPSEEAVALQGIKAKRTAREQRSTGLIDPMPEGTANPGVIAYVRRSTDDIHLISPDGTGDRLLWKIPQPFVYPAYDLAWRPDGRELAFSSQHEEGCSWYQSDIYAIAPNGAGYRRVTNSPACAALAGLPKGSVTVDVANYTSSLVWVYVQGAPDVKSILGSGTVTFTDVADFGPGVLQPSIGIWGLYRFTSYPPYADVQPGQTVSGGSLVIMQYSGFSGFGAGKITWKADGSALAYAMRSASGIKQIPANPSYGSIGVDLPVIEEASPQLVTWGPTPATRDEYLYSTGSSIFKENVGGIYHNTAGNTSGGTQLVLLYDYSATYVRDIEWLPDASGFLFTLFYVDFEYYSDVFAYDFATQSITQLTHSLRDDLGAGGASGLSISPDGGQVVLERLTDFPIDSTSSLWIMNSDGSNLHKLIDDAGRPAWGPSSEANPVHAGFARAPASGMVPLLVQFTNQSTGDYDTCRWTFGDGGTSTSCGNPTHTYTTKGIYTVALTVTGAGGSDTLTQTGSVQVYEPAPAELPRLVFSQWVNGQAGGKANRTRIVLCNNSARLESGSVLFLNAGGKPVPVGANGTTDDEFLFEIEPWGTYELETTGQGGLQSGVIEVYSNWEAESVLEGTEIFDLLGSYVSVQSSPLRPRNQVYISVTAAENAGIAISNPAKGEIATLRLQLVDSAGILRETKTITVGARSQYIGFVTEPKLFATFFNSYSGNFRGTLNIVAEGTASVAVLGLIQKKQSGALLAIPVSSLVYQP